MSDNSVAVSDLTITVSDLTVAVCDLPFAGRDIQVAECNLSSQKGVKLVIVEEFAANFRQNIS